MTAKENSIEDCLTILKKAYEKEKITIAEFLQNVRKLSNKQFKAVNKRNRVVKYLYSQAQATKKA